MEDDESPSWCSQYVCGRSSYSSPRREEARLHGLDVLAHLSLVEGNKGWMGAFALLDRRIDSHEGFIASMKLLRVAEQ